MKSISYPEYKALKGDILMQYETSEYKLLPFALLKVHDQAGKMIENVGVSIQPANTVVHLRMDGLVYHTQMRFICITA